MSQIPGFSLGSMGSTSNQQPQQNIPQNMIFSQQHLLPQHQSQQRTTQTSPPHAQGVPDSDHRRIWHSLDQQVRANTGDAQVTNFPQMAQYFRNSNLHPQQANLQGFPQQIQPPNINGNQVHHLMNPPTNQTSFNPMLAHLNSSQLQNLDPAYRQIIQQRLGQQHAQQQNAGNMAASYVDLGFSPSTSHSVTTNASAADLARQYDLISRASLNQGQNGNSMNLNLGNPLSRPGQVPGLSNSSVVGQQAIPFPQANNVQIPHNIVSHQQSLVAHQNPVTAATAAQQVHMNRQIYSIGNSVDVPGNTNTPNAAGNIMNNNLPPRVLVPNSIQSAAPAGATAMNAINPHRRVEVQLANIEKSLSESGWYPGLTTQTEHQSKLLAEYEQAKHLYSQYRSIVAHGINMHGGNGQSVHGWQPGQASKQNAPSNVSLQQATPRIASGGPGPQQAHISGSSTSSFPQQAIVQQQPQTMFTPMQQQSNLPVPRTPSAQPMNNVIQQAPQQQQRPPTTSIPGSMYDLQQGQSTNSQNVRPPTVPPQSGAANTPQTNAPPIRTPMQGQGPTSVPQSTQSAPSNVSSRQPLNGDNADSRKIEFEKRLKSFLDERGITIDANDLFIDTREVQLQDLFAIVMRGGASVTVTQNDSWSIIGANLGFVQFPGAATEPARSSPQIALHLKYLYEKYLLTFEQWHLAQLNQDKRRLAIQAQPHQNSLQLSQQQLTQQQQTSQRHSNNVLPFIPNSAGMIHPRQQNTESQAQHQQQPQQTAQNLNPQHMIQSNFHGTQSGQVQPHLNVRVNTYTQLAHMSVEQLRKLGIPENNIALIEQNRPLLQKQLMQQQMVQQLQRGQTQTQQGQAPQINFPMAQMPNLRSNVPNLVNGLGEGSQMHSGNAPQLSQQGQTAYQQMSTQVPSSIPQVHTRPTMAQLNSAGELVRRMVAEQTSKPRRFQSHVVRDVERVPYVHAFKQLYELVIDVEKKLPMFHAFFQDIATVHKLITIISTTKEQQRHLSSGSNHYILSFQMVNRLWNELKILWDRFQQALVKLPPSAAITSGDLNPPNNPPTSQPLLAQPVPNETSSQPQAIQGSAQLPAQQTDIARVQPMQHSQQNLQVPAQMQLIPKSKRPHGNAANAPSPAAPTTPFTNAPTPPASSSPHTPKSPPKQSSQASANSNNPPVNAAPVPAAKPKPTTMNRRSSKAGAAPAVSPAALAVEEPKAGTKRPREDDQSTVTRPTPLVEPVAKKPKTEDWDGLVSEEVEKRQQEINSLETNQDVQNFLARAADDILIAGVADSSAINPGEDKSLQEFLSSVPSFSITDPFHIPTFVDPKFGDLSPNAENGVDTFLNSLFDFSKCATDDPIPSSSKLDPPDLFHSSTNPSTNPSPESAAETPKHENASINGKHRDNAIKIVDDSHSSLERSLWTEISSGEPAYYEHTNFKYDSELPAQGSPWAISGGA